MIKTNCCNEKMGKKKTNLNISEKYLFRNLKTILFKEF
ncbi:hypothetical protein [uncultured Gammaproteobacteria bacterium]|nr:hypothetical protein [uncultured Gammaproteobacteria bacterium]CAC9565386.1 hypothetical protein [uncultured Gammaproteobacteria bacterium]